MQASDRGCSFEDGKHLDPERVVCSISVVFFLEKNLSLFFIALFLLSCYYYI